MLRGYVPLLNTPFSDRMPPGNNGTFLGKNDNFSPLIVLSSQSSTFIMHTFLPVLFSSWAQGAYALNRRALAGIQGKIPMRSNTSHY